MSKRSEFITYLIDLGLDVDTRNYNIKAYKNDERERISILESEVKELRDKINEQNRQTREIN